MTPEQVDDVIAENIRAARARRRLTQEDLAADLGWVRPAVTRLEAGKRRLSVYEASAVCVALGIDLRELLRGADEDVLRGLGL